MHESLSRRVAVLAAVLAALGLVLAGCGGSDGGNWSCTWQCHSSGSSGSASYPPGPDPTQQCTADHGSDCNDFDCLCTQD